MIAVYYDSSRSHLCGRPTALNVVIVHALLGAVSSNWQLYSIRLKYPIVILRLCNVEPNSKQRVEYTDSNDESGAEPRIISIRIGQNINQPHTEGRCIMDGVLKITISGYLYREIEHIKTNCHKITDYGI